MLSLSPLGGETTKTRKKTWPGQKIAQTKNEKLNIETLNYENTNTR